MEYKECILNNCLLRVYPDGIVKVKRRNSDEYYDKKTSTNKGYKRLSLRYKKESKTYKIHRIVAFAYLELDIENPNIKIDHINRNRQDNQVDNLRLATHQENCFNTNAKGYYWDKQCQKWRAQIKVNDKKIHIGLFETEEEASRAYQEAKLKYHIIKQEKS